MAIQNIRASLHTNPAISKHRRAFILPLFMYVSLHLSPAVSFCFSSYPTPSLSFTHTPTLLTYTSHFPSFLLSLSLSLSLSLVSPSHPRAHQRLSCSSHSVHVQ